MATLGHFDPVRSFVRLRIWSLSQPNPVGVTLGLLTNNPKGPCLMLMDRIFSPHLRPARGSDRPITITIQQYPDSPAHVDGPMTTQDASQHSGNAKDLTPCV